MPPLLAAAGSWRGCEHLSSVHDERELESLKAAARQQVAAGRVFTQAQARRHLLEAVGLTFSLAVSSDG